MKPYSLDLRTRVIAAIETLGYTHAEAAEQFAVSERSVERWVQRQRDTGSYAPRPPAGGAVCKLAAAESTLRAAVAAQPDITLAALCTHVKTQAQISASASMMCREVARLRLPLKKHSALLNRRLQK